MPQRHDPRLRAREPTDPDVDFRSAPRPRHRADDAELLAVIALGGALGAAARYLTGQGWPTAPDAFPAATFTINVVGCGLIGILMALVTHVWTRQRLLRPFLGTGVLGGFTTFSTYTVDIQQRIADGHPFTALLYLALTVVAALVAVWSTAALTRRIITRRRLV